MYCEKCRSEIPDESIFCPNCGKRCNEENKIGSKSKGRFKKILDYTLNSIKHPITTIKDGGNNISTKINLIYIAVIALIIPLIKILSIPLLNIAIFKFIFKLFSEIFGSNITMNQIGGLRNQIFNSMGKNIDYVNQYGIYLLNYIALYGIILILIYIIYKYLIKAKFSLKDFTRVIAVASIINLIGTIIASLALFIGLGSSLFVNVVLFVLLLLIVGIGLSYILDSDNKFVYIFASLYGLSFILINYIYMEHIIHIIRVAYQSAINSFL